VCGVRESCGALGGGAAARVPPAAALADSFLNRLKQDDIVRGTGRSKGDTQVRSLSNVWIAFLVAALAVLAGCSGGDDASLRKRVDELEAENQALKNRLEKLSADLRPLQAKVDQLDEENQDLDRRLGQVDKDVQSRLTDMVQQAIRGGRRPNAFERVVPQEARFEVRPYLGFDGQNITADVAKHLNLKAETGVLVTDVREGAPAAVAGLAKNDVVQAFDGVEIKTREDMERAIRGKKPGDTVEMSVLRGEGKVELKIKLGMTKVRAEE